MGKVQGLKNEPDVSGASYNRSIYIARFQAEYVSCFPFLILLSSPCTYVRLIIPLATRVPGRALCRSRNDFMTVASLSPSPAVNPAREEG